MPSLVRISCFAVMSALLLAFDAAGQTLLAERLGVLSKTAPHCMGSALSHMLSPVFDLPMAVGIVSWIGWGGSFLLLRLGRWGRLYTPLVLHPAAVLLTIGGYGMAVAALFGVFISIERIRSSRSSGTVPALGLALGGAALAVPGFRSMFVAFSAPLVLVAPRAMLERNMLSFYLVALLPAAAVMGIAFFLAPAAPIETVRAGITPLSLPVAAAIPAAGLAAALLHDWRLGAALSVIAAGGFMAAGGPLLWPCGLACLAAAFALHRKRSLAAEIAFAAAVLVAAQWLARHMAGA